MRLTICLRCRIIGEARLMPFIFDVRHTSPRAGVEGSWKLWGGRDRVLTVVISRVEEH